MLGKWEMLNRILLFREFPSAIINKRPVYRKSVFKIQIKVEFFDQKNMTVLSLMMLKIFIKAQQATPYFEKKYRL